LAEIGWPKSEIGNSFPFSPQVVRRPILATIGDKARQGGAQGHEAGVGLTLGRTERQGSPFKVVNGGGFWQEGNGSEVSDRRSLTWGEGVGREHLCGVVLVAGW
jgi:hypothetical protein